MVCAHGQGSGVAPGMIATCFAEGKSGKPSLKVFIAWLLTGRRHMRLIGQPRSLGLPLRFLIGPSAILRWCSKVIPDPLLRPEGNRSLLHTYSWIHVDSAY